VGKNTSLETGGSKPRNHRNVAKGKSRTAINIYGTGREKNNSIRVGGKEGIPFLREVETFSRTKYDSFRGRIWGARFIQGKERCLNNVYPDGENVRKRKAVKQKIDTQDHIRGGIPHRWGEEGNIPLRIPDDISKMNLRKKEGRERRDIKKRGEVHLMQYGREPMPQGWAGDTQGNGRKEGVSGRRAEGAQTPGNKEASSLDLRLPGLHIGERSEDRNTQLRD